MRDVKIFKKQAKTVVHNTTVSVWERLVRG